MSWYVCIFSGVIITLLSYRKKRTISRMGIEQTNILERFFGTDFGITLCASVTMLMVLLFIVKADPTIPELVKKQQQMDIAIFKELGKRLATRVSAKSPQGKLLIIARRVDDSSKIYQDALLESIKSNLGSKLKVGNIKYLEVLKQETEPGELERPFRITNGQLDNLVNLNPDCTGVISLVGVEETFYTTRLAMDANAGKRGFALVTDNPYMLESALRNDCISYCVTPNPSYKRNPTKPVFTDEAPLPTFSDLYIEVDHKNLEAVAKRHRRMIYLTHRLD